MAYGQDFDRVMDPENPLSQTDLEDYWTGCAWVDIDNDNDLDLFLTNRKPGTQPRFNKWFRNEGQGEFTQIETGILVNNPGYWFGTSWGDYDNDGLTDVLVAGLPLGLYHNNGGGSFTKITSGALGNLNLAGIGAAWGDFNQDSYLDFIIVWPNWMPGPPTSGPPGPPQVMINNGPPDYSFTKLLGTAISEPTSDTYLHPTLADIDGDNDLDIIIGMGAGEAKPDLFYRNLFAENGVLGFEKITDGLLATDPVEGNQWSWIDVDNDGDLDAYLTNWANVTNNIPTPRPNDLYLNEGGTFTKVINDVIVDDALLSTSSTWQDFDNDGDLDCVVTSDSNFLLKYYQNDGTGQFQSIAAGELGGTDLHQSGCSAGDYDNDGDMDLFIPGPGAHNALFRNDLTNGYQWVKFNLVGTQSNRSGIGAVIRLKANVNGIPVWQRRDVSASNTFFGMNSLEQHFGLADAGIIDSILVEWPSGQREGYYDFAINQTYTITEGEGMIVATHLPQLIPLNAVIFPNPNNGEFAVKLEINQTAEVQVLLDTIDGKSSRVLKQATLNAGAHQFSFAVQKYPGIRLLRILFNGKTVAAKRVVVH